MIINQWYAVMPSNQIRKRQISAVRRLNLDLALFRYASGDLGCVADQCTHRGAALSKGKLNVDCVQCPFHGLEFDTKGKCRFIPANGIASKQDISRYNVRYFPVREEHGIIYLWYGDEDKIADEVPFFEDLDDMPFAYSEISDNWNAHYSRCIENQLDVVHLPFVHANTIGRGNRKLVNGPAVELDKDTIRTSADNEVDVGQHPKTASEVTVSRDLFLLFKFPNIWMNHISDKIRVMIFFAPVDDEKTILYLRFYSKASKLRFVNRIYAFFGKFGNRVIERQDKRIVVTQKPKVTSYRMHEKLLAGDLPVIEYRKRRDELKSK